MRVPNYTMCQGYITPPFSENLSQVQQIQVVMELDVFCEGSVEVDVEGPVWECRPRQLDLSFDQKLLVKGELSLWLVAVALGPCHESEFLVHSALADQSAQ